MISTTSDLHRSLEYLQLCSTYYYDHDLWMSSGMRRQVIIVTEQTKFINSGEGTTKFSRAGRGQSLLALVQFTREIITTKR